MSTSPWQCALGPTSRPHHKVDVALALDLIASKVNWVLCVKNTMEILEDFALN